MKPLSTTEYREAEPFTQAAAGPLAAWRHHWILGVVAALLGAALGLGAAFVIPVTYTAEARVAVGAGDLTSGAIAGFPVAASQLASNYARYVNDRGVAATDLPENVTLSASQIPESNVIRIEVESADAEAARSAANKAAQLLVDAVNGSGKTSATDVAADFEKAAKDDAAAQTDLAAAQHDLDQELGKDKPSKSKVKSLRSDVTAATAKADNTALTANALRQRYTNLVANGSTAANLQLIRTADGLESNRTSLLARLGLAGLAAGAAVGLIIAVVIERRQARSRNRRSARR
jgi:capsular polysaccharide biosynthesis protein